MAQSSPPGGTRTDLQMEGFAALVTPASAWQPGTIPPNALVLVPVTKALPDEVKGKLSQGAVLVDKEKMWGYLGFRGKPVQVMDAQGRPLAIGVEDLLDGLESHYNDNKQDANAGRIYAQELMKHGRAEQATSVLARVVASGGGGDDWLALGVAQLSAEQLDKAESTLKGAQNLLADNPYPSLNLAKVYKAQSKTDEQKAMILKAIELDPKCVDAWAFLFTTLQASEGDAAAIKGVTELADSDANKATAAPFVALQGIFSGDESKLDEALTWAKKAIERDENDMLALISISALYGQKGDLKSAIELLSKHENKMMQNVGLANNYLNALVQSGQMDRATKLLNALAGSPRADVKRFAQASSNALAREMQRKQAALQRTAQAAGSGTAASPIIQKP